MRILVFGVFDLLHKGHLNFLKQARALGDELVVSVARDANVLKFKGHLPVVSENERLGWVQSLGLADLVLLSGLSNPWTQIIKLKPDLIALGYDQKPYVAKTLVQFRSHLKKRGLRTKVVRLRPHQVSSQKTNKIRFISGVVKPNLGRGTRLGFPTANIKVGPSVHEGIYAAFTKFEGQNWPSLAFIGAPITFNETKKKGEVYILDYNQPMAGKRISVELLRKIRDNQKFRSAGALKKQMKKDVQFARRYFKRYNKNTR